MPSLPHEGLLELFRNRPALAAEILGSVLAQTVPTFQEARVVAADLVEVLPTERRADLVVVLSDAQGRPLLGIVVEVQLGRDQDKSYVWPGYVIQTRDRHRCPAMLLVVSLDEETAQWCARPIASGHPGFVLTPLVLGPAGIPVVTDAEEARAAPEKVVLSALAHGQEEVGEAIAEAFVAAAAALNEEQRTVYGDLVLFSLHEAARAKLEAVMKSGYEFQSNFARSYVARGKAEGKAEARAQDVIAVLEARGLEVPPAVWERVLASTDLGELDLWIRRAAVVNEARLLFVDERG